MEKNMVFGESKTLSVSEAVQDVFYCCKLVGWLVTKSKGYFCHIDEIFYSYSMTQEEADKIPGYRVDESENNGYVEICYALPENGDYNGLVELCEKIYKTVKID